MNLINPNNIDKWLFDYFEGNLSLHEKIEVESFLKNNPEFQADFDAWQESFLPETSFTYQHTNSLIKKAAFPRGIVALFFVIALIGGGALVYFNLPESNGQLSQQDVLNNNENLTSNNFDSELVKNQANIKTIEVITNENSSNANVSFENIMANDIDESDLNSVAIVNHSQTNLTSFTQSNSEKRTDQLSDLTSENEMNKYNELTSQEDINNNTPEDANANPTDDLWSEMTIKTNQKTPIIEEISSNVEANGVSLSIVRSVRKGVKMEHFIYKEISKEYLTSSFVKSHKGYIPINHAEKDYKNKKSEKTYPNYKSHRNESMAKNLTRLFNKDLALTVFNNRIMMKDNLMSLGANQSLAGNYKTPRVQMGYSQSLQNQSPYSAYLSTDARIKNHGIGFTANFNDIAANYQFYDASLIYAYNLDLGGFKLRPSVSGKYGKDAQISTDVSGTSTTISSDNITIDGGLMIETPSFYLGAQSKNMGLISYNKSLNQEDLFQGNRGYSFVIGTDYRKTFQQNIVISPQLYIDLINSQKPTYTFATTANINGLVGGASYASNNNMGLMIGGQLRNFRIMYHANTNINVIKAANFGQVTHEIGLQFMISKKTKGYLLYD